jgi:hypothetical protein
MNREMPGSLDSDKIAFNENLEKRKIATSWKNPKRKANKAENRKMVALALQIMVTKLMKNHCYKVGNVTRHQSEKGIIGLDLVRCTSRIYMINWAKKYIKLCKEITDNSKESKININPAMMNIYVDDLIKYVEAMDKGARYNKSTKTIDIDTEEAANDVREPDRKTFDVLTAVANSIDDDIIMTPVVPTDSPDNTVAFLDTQMWIDEADPDTYPKGKIMWKNFKKEMNAKIVQLNESAINDRGIRTNHTQEIVRHSFNIKFEILVYTDISWIS